MTDTDTEVTEELVRGLLRDQHPDLAELPLREVDGGWGNQMWRLGDELAVRVQRMDAGPGPQPKERRWLPALAPRLPLPVPVPVRSGSPSQRFPKTWTGRCHTVQATLLIGGGLVGRVVGGRAGDVDVRGSDGDRGR